MSVVCLGFFGTGDLLRNGLPVQGFKLLGVEGRCFRVVGLSEFWVFGFGGRCFPWLSGHGLWHSASLRPSAAPRPPPERFKTKDNGFREQGFRKSCRFEPWGPELNLPSTCVNSQYYADAEGEGDVQTL